MHNQTSIRRPHEQPRSPHAVTTLRVGSNDKHNHASEKRRGDEVCSIQDCVGGEIISLWERSPLLRADTAVRKNGTDSCKSM